MPSDQEIEAAARVIAGRIGLSADTLIDYVDAAEQRYPNWRSYEQVARDALVAAEKVRNQDI